MRLGLFGHREFLKLWLAHTTSRFGSEFTLLAIPLTAVLVLNASAAQMGLLAAVEFAPFLLLSLFAGVWVDRLRRRPIMIFADIARTVLLGSIPLAALFGVLTIEQLYVVGFCTGVFTVFFDVADQAYLPALVSRDHLIEGNSKLEVSRSVAQITGPGIAGGLVQIFTAPITVAIDAVSFLVSAVFLLLIRVPEPPPVRDRNAHQSVLGEVREGLAVVLGNPLLRSIAGCTGTSNLFGNALQAIFILYMTRSLQLEPYIIGIILAAAGPGALLGSLFAGRLANWFGLGTTIIGSIFLGSAFNLLIPFAAGPTPLVIGMLTLAMFAVGVSNPVYNINQVSLRQAITPDHLQGRMNASMRFIVWGTIPIGALLGGLLGESIGWWPTLLVGAVGQILATGWVLFSPVRDLKEQPAPVAA